MIHNLKQVRSWRLGIVVGAVAFSLVYLPAAFAGNKGFATCKTGQTKMCDNKKSKGACVKDKEIAKNQQKGYTFPAGGGNNPCPGDPVSPI
jgi:hypothetical protein